MTALAELLTPEQRKRLADRAAELRSLADLMTTPPRPGHGTAASTTEDARDHGLTAAGLRAAADRLYDIHDPRLSTMENVSAQLGHIRSRLRSLADAIDQQDSQ